MRTLRKNQTPFYFSLLIENRPVTREDEDSSILQTGEWEPVYGPPTPLKGNISAAKGKTETNVFGTDLQYDKVIVLADPHTPIDEFSVLYIDRLPILDEQGETETPFDYVVARVARSLNSVSIAVRKVNVSR